MVTEAARIMFGIMVLPVRVTEPPPPPPNGAPGGEMAEMSPDVLSIRVTEPPKPP